MTQIPNDESNESNTRLTNWRKINTQITMKGENTERHRFVDADRHSERLAKLKLGLRALRKIKTTQDETQYRELFMKRLYSESLVEDYIQAINQLGNQVAKNTPHEDLQNTCLLIENALYELTPHEFAVANTHLLSVFNEWSRLPESLAKSEKSADSDNADVNNETTSLSQESGLSPELEKHTETPDDSASEPNDEADVNSEILFLNAVAHQTSTLLPEAENNSKTLAESALDLQIVQDETQSSDDKLVSSTDTNNQVATLLPESEEHAEILEKLAIGLQLLQEFRAAQGATQANDVGIEPLQTDSIEAITQAINTLNEQAANNAQYADLQDACFLLEDAINELSEDNFAATKSVLLAALNEWVIPKPEITSASNNAAIEDEPIVSTKATTSYASYIPMIEQLGNQADEEGYSGLYSVSLLMTEALHELSSNVANANVEKTELSSLLDNWSSLVEAYRQDSIEAIDGIMSILSHPDLNMPIDENDCETITTLLVEEIGTRKPTVETQVDTLATHTVIDEPSSSNATVADDMGDDNDVVEKLSPMVQELVELLDTEAGLLNYRFLAVSFDEPIEERKEHLLQASEELERLTNASVMIGFEGFAEACKHINANIAVYLETFDDFTIDKREPFIDWISEVKAYLLVFGKKGAGKQLLTQMGDPRWVLPLTAEAYSSLLPRMRVTGLQEESAEEDNREKIATDDNISLDLPDDVNKELLDLLLQELPTYTQQFSEAIQRLQSGNGSSKDIDVAQRIAHTIKGSANTVGIKGIAVLTHQIEDILMACAKAHKQPNAALMNTLINASDCLEAMCESLLGQGEPPEDAREILQEVLDWANQIAKNGIQDIEEQQTPEKSQHSIANVDATQHSEPASVATPEPKEDTQTEKAESSQVTMVRVPTDQIENLFKLSGESIILNGQIYERQRRLKNQLQVMEAQFTLLQQLEAELEQLIDLKDLSGRSLVNTGKDFDALEMDQYNELHTASRRMVEAAVDAREISVDMKKELEHMNEILEYQQRLVINTQEAVMQTRFVPVSSIALRLQRGLRQTCRLTGKQGELTLVGENLLIDGDTLSALVEPLMHLLRNAVDHGLETEEERIAMGKPVVGQIIIEFDREGNSILVRCRDDGQGLDFGAIRHTAEQRGDIKAGDIVSEEELQRFILRPNFSTRTQSTQTSGRGVGMNVVNYEVLSLGGSLVLHSVRGKGLTVELRMPLPLSRSHALLANAGAYKVAISSKGLTQILYSTDGEIQTISNEQVLIVGEDIYPVVKLEDLLHVQDRRKKERSHGAVLLVQNENKITAVLVDSITDSREVVIKSLGYYMKKIHGFVGATILGDGSVTPVLDIPELLRAPVHKQASNQTANIAERNVNVQRILLVDDSLSQRRALEQILTDAGFRVHTARDGIEAVEWLNHSTPSIVITDLEMPRMNGLELASHIRAQAKLKTLPIIMITSRSTQKHREMADEVGINFYLVKPVQDDNLLTKIQSLMDAQNNAVHV